MIQCQQILKGGYYIKKEYVTIITGANWNDEIEREVKNYEYVKQVFLDSNNLEDAKLITEIQDILDNENIEDDSKFDEFLATNKILKLENEA